MYTDELQCKRAAVTNGMANPGVDVIPLSRFFKKIGFPVLISSLNYLSAVCKAIYKRGLRQSTISESPTHVCVYQRASLRYLVSFLTESKSRTKRLLLYEMYTRYIRFTTPRSFTYLLLILIAWITIWITSAILVTTKSLQLIKL